MSPSAATEFGPATSGPALLLPGLPWCVGIGALVSLLPIALVSDVMFLVAHLPTFVVLYVPAVDLSCRAREGQSVSRVAIAAVVGGLIASVALMLIRAAVVRMDRECGWIYGFTWLVLPIFGLVASALAAGFAAAVVGVARVVSRLRRNGCYRGQRS